jgi:hypothetical protein
MGTTSNHEKKVLKAHEQFIQMLRSHKVTQALAVYDCPYHFQLYRLFQGEKTTNKQKCPEQHHGALNAIFLFLP